MKLPRTYHMSAEQLAGQVLMPALDGRFRNRNSPASRRVLRILKQFQPGGVVLFGGNAADIRYWSDWLQKESAFPLLVGAGETDDSTAGFFGGTLLPHPLAFGAAGDKQLVEDAAEIWAREGRSVGINVCFAPVLNPAGTPKDAGFDIHAYHSRPEIISQYSGTFIEALQRFGIACIGKHFPHGTLSPVSPGDGEEFYRDLPALEKSEWKAFRDAIDRGVKGLMAGNLGGEISAWSEPALLENIIRQAWGYRGVLFSQSLQAAEIQKVSPPWQQAYLPLEAGIDVLLMPPQLPFLHGLLVARIKGDEAFRQRVEQAVERIFSLKKWLYRHRPAQRHPLRVYKIIGHPNHLGLAIKIAEKGVTLVQRSARFPLSLPEITSAAHLIFAGRPDTNRSLEIFSRELDGFFDKTVSLLNPSRKTLRAADIPQEALVIVSLCSPPPGENSRDFQPATVTRIFSYLKENNFRVVVILFGDPGTLKHFPGGLAADAVLLTYSDVPASQAAAFKALAGFIDIQGELPATLAKPFNIALRLPATPYSLNFPGEASLPKPAAELLRKAIQEKAFPGCVVLAAKNGRVIYREGFGNFDYRPGSTEVRPDTLYDLGSLTTVIAATPAIMHLVEARQLRLSDCLDRFYPLPPDSKTEQITIADLLSHQSGLPAWKALYQELAESTDARKFREKVVEDILRMPLDYEPGKKVLFSDLGFILLYDLVEKITGVVFDIFCRDRIFQPLGISSLQFNPCDRKKIPPTGKDEMRREVIQGVVHDANCFMMGGVSGHAGLFGSAADVAAIGQLFIQQGIYHSGRLFKHGTVEKFTGIYNPGISSRALGWDTPRSHGVCGKYFSGNSIGHPGFAGSSLWVDLQQKIVIVLLSNGGSPDARKQDRPDPRRTLHDALMEALVKGY